MDFDDTLIDNNSQLHHQDIEYLNNIPEGIVPIIATGRSLNSVKEILHNNNVLVEEPFPLGIVTLNGAVGQLPGEKTIITHYLDPELLKGFIELTKSFTDGLFYFFQPNKILIVNSTSNSQIYERADRCSADEVPSQINKVMVVFNNSDSVEKLRAQTRDWPAEMTTSISRILEVTGLGINKVNTVRKLLEKMGLDHLPLFSAGDGENDLVMKSLAKRFFVPDTAREAIRSHADTVINRSMTGIIAPMVDYIYKYE